jgi:hypothetical protein
MKTRDESKWIIENTKQRNVRVKETDSHVVLDEQTEKKRAKRKAENKLLGGGNCNNIEQELEPGKKKKQSKIRTKKARKFQVVQNSDGNKEKCINYLKTWHEDRQNWKFEKLRQIWLFRNMLDPLKVGTNILL